MKILIYEEFNNLKYEKVSKNTYQFNDMSGNDYQVQFHGPHNDFDGVETGVTYDLDFFTQEKDYKKLTNAGVPFSVSNLIFDTILKDFIKGKRIDTICIFPTEPTEGVKRYDKKLFTKYYLYLRTLNQKFDLPGWKVIPIEREKFGEEEKLIILINNQSDFWKENISNLDLFKTGK
jgi:hypothetical protein